MPSDITPGKTVGARTCLATLKKVATALSIGPVNLPAVAGNLQEREEDSFVTSIYNCINTYKFVHKKRLACKASLY
jgi:hypothetical protein